MVILGGHLIEALFFKKMHLHLLYSSVLFCGAHRDILGGLSAAILAYSGEWDEKSIEDMLNQYAEKGGLKMGKVAQPLRAALTGTTASPGIYEVFFTELFVLITARAKFVVFKDLKNAASLGMLCLFTLLLANEFACYNVGNCPTRCCGFWARRKCWTGFRTCSAGDCFWFSLLSEGATGPFMAAYRGKRRRSVV
jgi:hypothetical protein